MSRGEDRPGRAGARRSSRTFVQGLGHKKFHAKQIYHWIWKRGVTDFDEMTNLSRELRAALAEKATVSLPEVIQHQVSEDGTQKFVLRLADGKQIESVFIPDTPKQTFCVSTQVGCAMGCAFCLTGKMGLLRHLSAAEIAGQVRLLARSLDLLDKSFNIVLMGMGEPLQNYDDTMKALRMLNEKEGLDMHPKRVTLSTVGLVPMMDRLAQEDLMPNLAVSLHAASEEQRAAIVPPTQEVLDAGRHRRLQAVPAVEAAPHHVRVRDAGRRQRLGRGRAPAGQGARRRQGQGEPVAAQRGAGHSVRAAVGRAHQRVREDPRRQGLDGLGAQEPRPRHPRGVRAADRRRTVEQEVGRAEARLERCQVLVPWCCSCWCSCCVQSRADDVEGAASATRRRSMPPRRTPSIEKFVAAKGGTPIIENQTRLVFLAKDKDGQPPRIVGDFNGWAVTPQGYDVVDRQDDADRGHVVVVSREHVVHERAARVRVPLRQGVHCRIR